jgi:hypothetical protein
VSTPKRFTVTRQRVREIGEGLLEEEDLEDFEEMLKGAGAGEALGDDEIV